MTNYRPGTCKTCRMPGEINLHHNCSSCQSELARWQTQLAKDGLKTVKGRQYIAGKGRKARAKGTNQ